MKLYLIERKGCTYDEYDAHLIRAESEAEARKMAFDKAAQGGIEPKEEWMLESTTCEEITADGPSCFIISSYNAG